MAEKNEVKLTAFEEEKVETLKQISKYKLSCEANIVSILYKNPELLYNTSLSISDFNNNIWKVYFAIASDIIIAEKKSVLDEITVGLYLEKHSKLKAKYTEYGGYNTIQSAMQYVNEENFDGYILELKKWKAVAQLCKQGFPVKDRLHEYIDMQEEDIYNEFEAFLNHTFTSVSENIKSYNVFDGMYSFIDEMNEGKGVGLPFYNSPLLTKEVGGFNLDGHIYGLGASSGVGKSTMAFNYLVPSAIENNEKIVFIINEEDEKKFKKELLIWVANNIFKKEIHKYVLRDGHFSQEVLNILHQCAKWIEDKKDSHIFTVIPLERYSVNIVIKIIKKYASAFGVRMFVLDTFKESCDANTNDIFKSMMRDMVLLYDTIKPSAKNVGLFVTYQLGKGSLKLRRLTNNEIGQAKSIVDVMSVNIMLRRPFEDEFEDGNKELTCFEFKGKNEKTKVVFKMKRDKNYMIAFITKNRFGEADRYQIVSECDLSTNVYKDKGYTIVPQDW